jgi:hypothetical protein
MTAAPALDLFAPITGGVDDEVLAGLATLQHLPPLWDTSSAQWCGLLSALIEFETDWGAAGRACGWDRLSLYGLSPRAPRAALWLMGAAWITVLRGDRVTAIDAQAVRVVSGASSRLSVYRRPDRGAVLPWRRPA